jgi:hypothetical protein
VGFAQERHYLCKRIELPRAWIGFRRAFGVRGLGDGDRCWASHAIDVAAGERIGVPTVVYHENGHGPVGADILNAEPPVVILIAGFDRRWLHDGLHGDEQLARSRVIAGPPALKELAACGVNRLHVLSDSVLECLVLG